MSASLQQSIANLDESIARADRMLAEIAPRWDHVERRNAPPRRQSCGAWITRWVNSWRWRRG